MRELRINVSRAAERRHRDGTYCIRTVEDGHVGEHIPAKDLRRRVEQPRFRRGDRVEYDSVSLGGWQSCVVGWVHSDGRLMLECERSGTTVKEFADLDRCRASTVTVAHTASFVPFYTTPLPPAIGY